MPTATVPAANASWLPRKVPEWAPGAQVSSRWWYRISDTGEPIPLSALDATITSGSMSYCSKANHVPVRPHPVCTSSTISGMPSSLVSARTRRTKSPRAGTTPPSPWTSSRITAAGEAMPALPSRSDRSR